MARYALDLSEFDLTICHRAGAIHHGPDALSRFKMCHDPEVVKQRVIDAWGLSTELALETDLELGNSDCRYEDSLLFNKEVTEAQLARQIDQAQVDPGDLPEGCSNVRDVLAVLARSQRVPSSSVIDEFGSRAAEMYDMILTVGLEMPEIDKLTIGQIRQEQKDDRWCRHMYCHLKDNTLPADALEAASISAAAPHYVIDPELKVLLRHDPGGPEKEALP